MLASVCERIPVPIASSQAIDARVPDNNKLMMVQRVQVSVRDLRVCGAEPWKLAAGLECGNEGAVHVWDVRQTDAPLIRIKEETAVHAVDWHPAHPSILASGRAQRAHAPAGLKVWDMAGLNSDTPQQPIAIIQTMDGISNIMWRPTYRTHMPRRT